MKKLFKKSIAVLLAAAMLLPYLVWDGFAISAGGNDYGQAHVDCYSKVKYDEETNTFTLDLEISAELYDHYENGDDASPDRGYFSANYTGWYLVELWGGNGADGLSESSKDAGKGGKGGYVYAKMYLKKDDILFYSLGGNGQSTFVSGEGGGGNGGGHGGTKVTYGVGGGGGYSALFYFDDAKYFKDNYLDTNNEFIGENISDYDRLTKYIMIAGGGGGGGSPISGSAEFAPDGGAGGTIGQSAIVGEIQGIGATVAGTYYSGDNGKSSDTSTKYVGQGGREKPGAVVGTVWNWMSGELPNDWSGSYNAERPGGSGGAGNLRGGAGGGGYSGGSGGIQQSIISPTNIGGGGGGSSFIAAQVNGQNVTTTLTEKEQNLLDSSDSEMLPSSGAISITYLPGEGSGINFAHLPKTSVTFTISPYFTATAFDYTQKTQTDGKYNFTYESTPNGTVVTISDISLIPTENNLTGSLGITLGLTPKPAFAGGNDVPLIGGTVELVSAVDGTQSAITLEQKDSYHVNVPLNFEVISRGHTVQESVTLSPQDMYVDRYADIRNELRNGQSSDPMYAFIEEIGDYTVEGMTEDVIITQSTSYSVSFTVVPKNDETINPIVGPEIAATTFTAQAEVIVLEPHQGHLNGQELNFTKTLTYNETDNTYTYTLTTQADNSREAHLPEPKYRFGAGVLEYTVEHNGYYLIQVWGGDGANGLDDGVMFGSSKFTGGIGAAGGYSYGYLELKAGTYIRMEKVGLPGSAAGSVGGGGGGYTILYITYPDQEPQVLAIAGGGGGGGNAIAGYLLAGANGTNAAVNNTISTELQKANGVVNDASYNGAAGGVGNSPSFGSYNGGTAGASGQNYFIKGGNRSYSDESFQHLTAEEFTAAVSVGSNLKNEDKAHTGYGGAYISCLELTDHSHVTEKLEDYTIEIPFSQYFTVDLTSMTGVNNCENVSDENKTLVYADKALSEANVLTISDIDPHQDGHTHEEDGVMHYESSIDFSISVTLKPKDGFLGGNDVPVTVPTLPENFVGRISQKENSAKIPEVPKADYANVKLGEISIGELEGHELIYPAGEEGEYSRANLYTWTDQWAKPTGDMEWTADFLKKVDLLTLTGETEDVGAGPWSVPQVNIYYDVTVGVTSPGPEKATVGPQVSGILKRATASVLVQSRLIFDLTGLDTDVVLGVDNGIGLDPNMDFEVILSPQTGYALPGSVTLQYTDGSGDVPFGYNAATGSLVIPKSALTGSMKLTASGTQITYKIYYTYEQTPESTEETTYEQSYHYGDTVSAWDYRGEEIAGYTFGWRWLTHPSSDGVEAYGDSLDGKQMPNKDVWVIGTYTPKEYVLRVEYQWSAEVDPNNQNLPALTQPVEQTYRFGDSYEISSPRIEGYAATPLVVRGVVNAALIENAVEQEGALPLITETVTYAPNDNRLRINYKFDDTGEIIVVSYDNIPTGQEYSVDVQNVEKVWAVVKDGYTVEPAVVEGVMSSGGAEWDVKCSPKDYEVKLMVGETPLAFRYVYYNSIYGYTKDAQGEKVFDALPEQVHQTGSKFLGWYIQNGNEKIWVTNETKFDLSHLSGENTVTLQAAFETEAYLVTVEHVYLNGTDAALAESTEVAYGSRYECAAKELTGYTAYILGSEGDPGAELIGGSYYVSADKIVIDRMPAQPVDRAFIYIGNLYSLSIEYKYGDSNGGHQQGEQAHEPYQATVRYGDSWGPVASPEVKDQHGNPMICTRPELSGVMDSTSGITETVYYYTTAPTISVTVSWGDLTYNYNRGTWNTQTHRYDGTAITPKTEESNKISIANKSSIPIDATLTFANNPAFTEIRGYFTETEASSAAEVNVVTVARPDSPESPITEDVWLWLGGTLPDTVSGSMVIGGQCTVSIAGGG